MKKIAAMLICVLLLCSVGIAEEITFRDIPWGSNINEFEDSFGFDVGGIEGFLPHWSSFRPVSSIDRSRYSVGYDVTIWPKSITFQVAGYDLDFIFAYFYYGVDNGSLDKSPDSSEFYMAEYIFDVEDVSGAYMDLRAKMTSLYGEGEDENGNPSEDYYSTVWYGENDTAVRLLVKSNSPYEGFSIRLVYGKTNSDDYVEYLEELARMEQIQEEQVNRLESTDGL